MIPAAITAFALIHLFAWALCRAAARADAISQHQQRRFNAAAELTGAGGGEIQSIHERTSTRGQ